MWLVGCLVCVSAARKTSLFVDKYAIYPPNTLFLRNVNIAFLPANCASMLQPLDLGIISCVKAKCRKTLVQKN
jgi:hypothetical protein